MINLTLMFYSRLIIKFSDSKITHFVLIVENSMQFCIQSDNQLQPKSFSASWFWINLTIGCVQNHNIFDGQILALPCLCIWVEGQFCQPKPLQPFLEGWIAPTLDFIIALWENDSGLAFCIVHILHTLEKIQGGMFQDLASGKITCRGNGWIAVEARQLTGYSTILIFLFYVSKSLLSFSFNCPSPPIFSNKGKSDF